MIDPFHLEAYGKTAVNYNRDIEIFPVVNAMFELIAGKSPYHSPTDMGVNMAGNCIVMMRPAAKLPATRSSAATSRPCAISRTAHRSRARSTSWSC